MRKPARVTGLALSMAVIVALITACGGDDGGDGDLVIRVQPDLSNLAEADRDDTLLQTALVLQERVAQMDGEAAADINDDGTISVTVRGVPADQAAQLLGSTAQLRFAQPRRDPDGNMLCEAADGTEVAVARDAFKYGTDGLPVCVLEGDATGEILWEDAVGADGAAQLTTAELLENGVVFRRDPSPALIVTFNPRGAALLNEISVRVLNAPLGIFIDDDLVGGPKVTEQLNTGSIVIAGVSARDARIIRAQLNAGESPVPIIGAGVQE